LAGKRFIFVNGGFRIAESTLSMVKVFDCWFTVFLGLMKESIDGCGFCTH